MIRQKIRKLCITTSMLLFPVTIYYLSPALPFGAALESILNGSLLVFGLLFLASVFFGRLFCAYLCPAGGLQECAFPINGKRVTKTWKSKIKYAIWVVWLATVAFLYIKSGGITKVDFFYQTTSGISVMDISGYVIYYGIAALVFIPGVLFGKRVFCHYFCWIAPFMVLGVKLRERLHLPGLHVAPHPEKCVSCEKCTEVCPMSLDVANAAKHGTPFGMECIQCGACADACPKGALHVTLSRPKPRNIRRAAGMNPIRKEG